MKRNSIIIILLIGVFLFQKPPTLPAEMLWPATDHALREWLSPISRLDENVSDTRWNKRVRSIARFYQHVGFHPAWTDRGGLFPQGEFLLKALANASEAGLSANDYRLPNLGIIRTHGFQLSDDSPLIKLAPHLQFDVALTDRMLRYARHLSQGRVTPETLSKKWISLRRSATRDIPAELAQALLENRLEDYIESLQPSGQEYERLKKALGRYEAIRVSGGWPTITPGPTLQLGDTGPRVDTLRRRLMITADLTDSQPKAYHGYDAIVETAVKRFQRRHGLAEDGLVGQRTLSELNIPVERQIVRLQLNIERRRWLPDNLGDRYLIVNIPAFELSVMETNARIDSFRVIVGKKHRQTPVMTGRMTYLEINPYWNIPRKIARRDILPKVLKNPDYLTRQGIRIFDSWGHQARELDPAEIEWENVSIHHFPFRLRQDPSDKNALGQVKFIFPNPKSIYIHDTPGKSLFNRPERSFSSGCVRVETPLALADDLLHDQGWDHARLEAAVTNGQRQTVVLKRPIPVHLVYFTAWVDEKGVVNFRKDIYGRDRELLIALAQSTSEPFYCRNEATTIPLLASGMVLGNQPIKNTNGFIPTPMN